MRAVACGAVVLATSGCDPSFWLFDEDDGGVLVADAGFGPEEATGSASTRGTTRVTTPRGASLQVPEGAVPAMADGGPGTIAFSIEVDNQAALPPLPANVTRVTDIYRFGPSSTNFVTNVAPTLPVKEPLGNRDLVLYRLDETTKNLTLIGRDYDATANTLSGQTTHFSLLFGAAGPRQDSASGCTVIDNSQAGMYRWKNIVISQVVSLAFPTQDGTAIRAGDMASLSSEGCSSGVCNKGRWYLPQGTYQVCVEEWAKSSQQDLPRVTGHWFLGTPLVVNKGWHHPEPCEGHSTPGTLNVSSPGATVNPGTCPTRPPPTASIGTGAVQISLRWHSATPIDLDLYVTDPANEELSYRKTSTASGGALDVDNKCDNYANGRPENGFWPSPPAGAYKIQVDWYGDCSRGSTSTSYEVRVVNKGIVKTYTGTISSSNTGAGKLLIDTITVR
jgi:hypothetical protein